MVMHKDGSKSGRRAKGTPNKATAQVMAVAQRYTAEAVEGLVTLTRDAEQPGAVRLGAMRELLDRAHGRPAQAVAGADGEGPAHFVIT